MNNEARHAVDEKLWDLLAADLGGREEAERLGLRICPEPVRSATYEWTLALGDRSELVRISGLAAASASRQPAELGALVIRVFRESLKRLRAA